MKVPDQLNFNSKFGVEGFVEEFGFAHYKARRLEAKGRPEGMC